MTDYQIGSGQLSLAVIENIIQEKKSISLSALAIERIEKCRKYLDDKLNTTGDPIYGINTGFGYLQNVKIEAENLTSFSIIYYCRTLVEQDKKYLKTS